jgi:hypothetical protein
MGEFWTFKKAFNFIEIRNYLQKNGPICIEKGISNLFMIYSISKL